MLLLKPVNQEAGLDEGSERFGRGWEQLAGTFSQGMNVGTIENVDYCPVVSGLSPNCVALKHKND